MFSDHVIKADYGTFKGYTTLMVDLNTYEFKDLNTGKLHLKNSLLMHMSKKYMGRNISVPPLKNHM